MADSLPAGTVVNYGGIVDANSRPVLEQQGWLPCDGTSYPVTQYADLYAAIGAAHGATVDGQGQVMAFNVPDLQGRFVRGVNGAAMTTTGPVDPSAGSRFPAASNGNSGNNVGSMELDATTKPATPFVTNSAGDHTHEFSNTTADTHKIWKESNTHFASPGNADAQTSQAGAHTHQVTGGGDAQTRPINMALHFLIKHSNT